MAKKHLPSYVSLLMGMVCALVLLQFFLFIIAHYVMTFPVWSTLLFVVCGMILFLAFSFYWLQRQKDMFLVRFRRICEGEEVPVRFQEEKHFESCLQALIQRLKILENHVALHKALKQKYQEENVEIHLDSMTKLFTKEYLYKVAPIEISKARAMGIPITVLMLDVDNFKYYNDRRGHLRGDEVLISLAKVLKNSIRATDLAVRYGGEEFLIFLPNSPKKYAIHVARRIQEAVEREDFADEEVFPQGRLTLSIGIASIPSDCYDLRGLIEKADKALYEAKRSGKNAIIWK